VKSITATKLSGFVPLDPAGPRGNVGNRQSSPVPDTCPSTTDAGQPAPKPTDVRNPTSSEHAATTPGGWAHHPSLRRLENDPATIGDANRYMY